MRFSFWKQQVAWFPLFCALLASGPANGATVTINCDLGQSISAALATLDPVVPNTVYVSGTCNENVYIESFDHLTLIAKAGASINDASSGNEDVVTIFHASRVTLQGFKVNGGADCLVCQDASVCQLYGNTFENGGTGANIFQAQARIIDDVFQNNGTGLFLFATADVWAINVTVQANQASGAHVGFGSSLHLLNGSVIQNNGGNGIEISNNSHAFIKSA
jgi:nitrous oxidase accessory protein NosD